MINIFYLFNNCILSLHSLILSYVFIILLSFQVFEVFLFHHIIPESLCFLNQHFCLSVAENHIAFGLNVENLIIVDSERCFWIFLLLNFWWGPINIRFIHWWKGLLRTLNILLKLWQRAKSCKRTYTQITAIPHLIKHFDEVISLFLILQTLLLSSTVFII